MKKIANVILSLGLIIGLTTVAPDSTEAKIKIINYKNCKELNKVHKGGVAKSSKIKNKGGKTKFKPVVSKQLYEVNKGKDRDKDGIACER